MARLLRRTSESVGEIRSANRELELANTDLHELFRFASGIAARAHDRTQLVLYAQDAISSLTGTRVVFSSEGDGDGSAIEVRAGDVFGGLRAERGRRCVRPRTLEAPAADDRPAARDGDREREPRRAPAEGALDTITALSRSIEAKDYYTGGHTERVAAISVALARRLGYDGAELEAVEIGALLHDIGKIGVPEHILHKPAPLADEWDVIREHPVISDYILSEVDLPAIVRQIARSSHERIDGAGYPDGLAGDDIPLPVGSSSSPTRSRRRSAAAAPDGRTRARRRRRAIDRARRRSVEADHSIEGSLPRGRHADVSSDSHPPHEGTRMGTLQRRLRSNEGFTLIELLVVIIIIGILLAIAIPSYLKFKDRANTSAAAANVRAAVPGIEAYAADHNGYTGATSALLQASYDAGIKHIRIVTATSTSYCVESTVGPETWHKAGPSASVQTGACP